MSSNPFNWSNLFKDSNQTAITLAAILGVGWWIQSSMAEIREEQAKSWIQIKKDSDERFYEQLKEIRNISERVAVIETKIEIK